MAMKLPDLVIAGFSKCGTTALAVNLEQHPGVRFAKSKSRVKELLFFTLRWKRGLEWYRSRMPDAPFVGEKTPSYVYSRTAMERMAAALPGVRIALCMRNPVDRLYSWYNHKGIKHHGLSLKEWPMERYREFKDIEKYDPVATGYYASVIKANVLPLFPRERICFVIQERMAHSGFDEVNRVLAWCGLEPVHGEARAANRTRYSAGHLDPVMRRQLLDLYRPHIEETFELLGFRVPEWER